MCFQTSLQNTELLCCIARHLMVLMKAVPVVWNKWCFLGCLKLVLLLEKILSPLSCLLLLLVFTPRLPLVFFQYRLVQSLCERVRELMQANTKLFFSYFFFFSPEFTLTQDTHCFSFTAWALMVLPWHLGGDSTVLGGYHMFIWQQC